MRRLRTTSFAAVLAVATLARADLTADVCALIANDKAIAKATSASKS